MMRRLPDVVGIGSRRCGSSWLHAVLNSHPEIGKPPNGLHFFSQHAERGLDWYAGQMAPYADRKVLLEFSVSYLYPEYCGVAAERMRKAMPEARLFLCVRNPVERAYSDYLRSIRMGEIDATVSFEQAIETQPVYLDRGRYATLLQPYLEAFSRERIKVLLYEDLEEDPVAFAADLASFLDVPPSFQSTALHRAEPKGKTVRSQWLNNAIRGVKDTVDGLAARLGQADRWSNWKGRHVGIYEKALDLTHREQELASRTSKQLAREFHADVACIEALTGKDLKGWYGD
jgi:LPS sulfotransferase NodH